MKRVEAIIDPPELDKVRGALSEAGIEGMTVLEARGFDRNRARREVYFGSAEIVHIARKVKIAIVASDDRVGAILGVLEKSGFSVLVTQVVEAVRIRTGERGDQALESRAAFRLCDSPSKQEGYAARDR